MGSRMPSCRNPSAKDELKFITSIRIASSASAPSYPSHRGRFHGRSPVNARRREESILAAHSPSCGHCFLHSAGRSPEKWQCLPGNRPSLNSSRWTCPVFVLASSAQRPETTVHRLALFSFGSSGSIAPSPCRLPGRLSRPIGSCRVPSSLGARTIPGAAARRALHAAGSESSLLDFLLRHSPGLFRRSRGFSIRAALRMRRLVILIGANDLLHQIVAHHVLFSELHVG